MDGEEIPAGTPERLRIRLMFEWGGGSLWCGDDAALARYGVGEIEDQLPLSPATRQRLEALSIWHDTSLDWDYPPDPGPWSDEERARFESEAHALLAVIQAELGDGFEVVYRQM